MDLGGSVNGLTGLTATSAAFILPAQQPTYTLNGCPIMAASCIQISTQRVPVSNPLGDIQIGQNFGGLDVKYGLPDVADRDY